MAILTAAVVLVGVLVVLDLVLTLGLIRRLRTHADLIGKALDGPTVADPRSAQADEPAQIPVGKVIEDFSARSTDGRDLSRDTFTDGAVVGFFSPSCEACWERLPGFLTYAGSAGRDRVLAVVQGAEQQAADLVARLQVVAQVVVEPYNGTVASAFDVQALPSMCVVDADWRVSSSGYGVEALLPAAVS